MLLFIISMLYTVASDRQERVETSQSLNNILRSKSNFYYPTDSWGHEQHI